MQTALITTALPLVPLMALQPYPSFRSPYCHLSTEITQMITGYAKTLCASVKMKLSSREIDTKLTGQSKLL